jgi:hypothetical protein
LCLGSSVNKAMPPQTRAPNDRNNEALPRYTSAAPTIPVWLAGPRSLSDVVCQDEEAMVFALIHPWP